MRLLINHPAYDHRDELTATAADTLRLHPENPRYFEWRGKPTVLITSADHYGTVLNADFDFVKYLATLEKDGLNLTRTFERRWVSGA